MIKIRDYILCKHKWEDEMSPGLYAEGINYFDRCKKCGAIRYNDIWDEDREHIEYTIKLDNNLDVCGNSEDDNKTAALKSLSILLLICVIVSIIRIIIGV